MNLPPPTLWRGMQVAKADNTDTLLKVVPLGRSFCPLSYHHPADDTIPTPPHPTLPSTLLVEASEGPLPHSSLSLPNAGSEGGGVPESVMSVAISWAADKS